MFEQSGLTKFALARSFGDAGQNAMVNRRNNITWWAQGRRVPSRINIEKLAKGLGCAVEDICDEVVL
ncbi:helix-turn-helix domain-containing protein [Nonomuraea bangladeshensis]|uniref:helix-turn-helix domain-containing protein n=1 Tax=Nonomuraea bangladeshensis TaxID=404385 RepID=UPI003C2E1A26